jgi:hypothetical protein
MPAASPPTFAIECACGTVARGERLPKPQTVPCQHCGRPLFVFPWTPPPFDLAGTAPAPGTSPPAWRQRLRFWLAPAAAALVALAVVGAVIAAIVHGYRQTASVDQPQTEASATQTLGERLEAARAALADGSYRLACRELEAAAALSARFPRALEHAQARDLARWRRQATLLADLLPESVQEVVRHSVGLADGEWEAVFRERYAGRAVVLDAPVLRDAAGHVHIDYHLEAAGAVGVWEFDRLQLFERLPLQRPQRLVFGFRLQSVRRAARDRWVVVPEPDSGVLLTDPLVLAGLSAAADAELLEVLKRQAEWDDDGP